jgi:hypothetical protein
MENERRHHYVPQFILKNWSVNDNNQIFEFNKEYLNLKQRSIPKQATLEKGLYHQWYEELLAGFENKISTVLKKITESKSDSCLNSIILDNKVVIAKFIVLQRMRTLFVKHTIEEMMVLNAEFNVKNHIGVLNNLLLNLGFTEESLINEYKERIGSVIKDAQIEFINARLEQADILLNYKWLLRVNETGIPFLITDLGVAVVNLLGLPQLATEELFMKGAEIILPLTPSISLCLFENTALEDYKSPLLNQYTVMKCTERLVFAINQIQTNYAYKYVYSSSNNKDYISGLLT